MIASPLVTALDDSTMPGEWGSIDIDDEGNFGTKRVLIKDGVLKDCMIDDFNGRRMNREGNGSSRRQNFKFCPTSRMSNTYIANGKSTREEIYHEHLGMMDEEDYLNHNLAKIEEYRKNGIFIGKNLILTFESASCPLNIGDIRKSVKEIFCR